MIQKLTKLTARMLATLFAVFATTSAWADASSLEETGGCVPVSAPALAFKDITLSQLGKTKFPSADVCGGYSGISGTAIPFFCRTEERSGDTLVGVSYQAHWYNDGYVKGVTVKFTDGEGGVYAQLVGAKALGSGVVAAYGTDFTGNTTAYTTATIDGGGYGLYNLKLHSADEASSININFHNGEGNKLHYNRGTAETGVGPTDYAVTQKGWSQMGGENNASMTGVTLVGEADSKTFYANATVTVGITGTRGSWGTSSYTPATDVRHSYIDENANNTTPTVTVTDIPFEFYRVVFYPSTDSDVKFGYVTINGINLTSANTTKDTSQSYPTITGTDGWGRAQIAAYMEGVNYLVSPVFYSKDNLNSALTVVGHRMSDGSRGCIAAIQILKVDLVPDEATIDVADTYAFEDLFDSVYINSDLIINVNEDATLSIPENTVLGYIEFNVASGKTLTLTGSTLTAKGGIKIVGEGKVSVSSATALSGTIKGSGTIAYTGAFPSGATFDNSAWTGTVWIKGADGTIQPNDYGNAQSKVKFSGVQGEFPTTYTCTTPIELSNSGYNYGIYVNNGSSRSEGKDDRIIKLPKLIGDGAFWTGGSAATVAFHVTDWSEYTGSLQFPNKVMFLGDTVPSASEFNESGAIYVCPGATVAIPAGVSYRADGGIRVKGTLKFVGSGTTTASVTADANSTLDLSEASSGTHANSLTLSSGTTIKLPAGAMLPYQIATSSGNGGLIDNVTVQIGNESSTTGYVAFSGGAITTLTSVDIDTDKTYSVADVFGTPSATSAYEINVTSDATLTVPDTTVGTIKYNFTATGNTVTLAGGYKIPATASYLKITDASSLTAGNYTLFRWTTPQQFTTTCTGYGRFASVDTTGLDSSLTAEVIYGAKAIYLRVYNTEAQAARKPLVIWPYGDSITEGYNAQHTGANYRILLYQKLRMLGYNVKSTGVYGLDDGNNSIDPSGEPLSDTDKWHSAKHGAPVSAGLGGVLAGRAALIENVDTLCVQAGTPDVVLLHIGVNDLSLTSDVDSVFEAWTDVVGRLVRNLPNSKIVVSTALYGRNDQATRNSRVTSYNDKIKAKIADMPTEWKGHVVLADLCSLVDSNTTGILYSQDTVHPDWWGYDQMAEGWLEKIVELYGDPTATDFPSQAALPAIPDDSALGAANKSELADYRAGFTKYGDIRIERGQDIGNIVYDNVDENAAVSNIGRVGYFVEYVRTDNHAHKWVWVDMDAFGDRDIAAVGLPSANHQQVVNRLHVYSNHGAIDNVAADNDTVSGFIEFTPYNIHQNASSVEGAPADTTNQMDWNDTVSSSGQFAAMQVFRIAPPSGRPAQTIFAFNNWRGFTESAYTPAAEFGIGNFAQHFWSGNIQTLDYIYTYRSDKMNANAYTVKKIEIWTKPVYEATVDDDSNFSELTSSLNLPVDTSVCDLVVNVTANSTLTFDSDISVCSIVFNVAEGTTLTLAGTSNLTAAKGITVSGAGTLAGTLEIPEGLVVILESSTALDGLGILSGEGELRVGANIPSAALRTLLTKVNENDSSTHYWKGTLAFVGLTNNSDTNDFRFELYGTADSKIKLTNCAISYLKNNNATFAGCLILNDDESHNGALRIGNGYSGNSNDFGELAGNGNMVFTSGPLQLYRFHTAPNYTGSISIEGGWDGNNAKYNGRRIVFGTLPATVDNYSNPASITVDAGVEAGLGEGATWNAPYGIFVSGTLIVNGDANLTSTGDMTNHDNATNVPDPNHIVFNSGSVLKYKKSAMITLTGDVIWPTGDNHVTLNIAELPAETIKVPLIKRVSGTIDNFGASTVTVVPPTESPYGASRWTTYTEDDGDDTIYGVVVKPGTLFSVY